MIVGYCNNPSTHRDRVARQPGCRKAAHKKKPAFIPTAISLINTEDYQVNIRLERYSSLSCILFFLGEESKKDTI
jgi:hypothetical protein